MAQPDPLPSSYRALFSVPSLGRVLLSMQVARIGQSMTSIVVILFALQRYHSAGIAGLVAFAATAPGIFVSPIAGALLDRHGRVRLIILDYGVAAASLALTAALAYADALPAGLLIAIAAVSSLTGPLSGSGLRSLFPLIVPRHLWERVNALDSNGWVAATIVGAPIGAITLQAVGAEATLLVIAALYVLAAFFIYGSVDPRPDVETTGSIVRDAWLGLLYTTRNPTLRALAISISTLNIGGGVIQIAVPLIVIDRLHMGQDVVGILFGISGIFGVVAASFSGRLRTEGREKRMLVWPCFGVVLATLCLLLPGGVWPIALSMALSGLLNGPMDIALFTVRQRRTDPAWTGRAFTVSMNLNFAGFPVGAAVGGAVASVSIDGAIWLAALAALASALLALWLLPATDEAPDTAAGRSDLLGRRPARADD